MNHKEYVKLSLELHLFFDRIMKEHSLFLEAAFTEKDNELKSIARNFQQIFSNTLEKIINLADGNISKEFLSSEEMVTKNTLIAENQTSSLSGITINTDITLREVDLRSGTVDINEQLIQDISKVNREILPVIQNLIQFKNDILNKVLNCQMYTTNYPLLISHIMNEAKMYYTLLSRVENRQPFTMNDIYEQEMFWNEIMKEHAEFIRGLLDPSEKELILMADQYAESYNNIIQNYSNFPNNLTSISLQQTIDFKNFKVTGEEGILNCKIKSIIIPLLADHVVREANHFLRILRNATYIQ